MNLESLIIFNDTVQKSVNISGFKSLELHGNSYILQVLGTQLIMPRSQVITEILTFMFAGLILSYLRFLGRQMIYTLIREYLR